MFIKSQGRKTGNRIGCPVIIRVASLALSPDGTELAANQGDGTTVIADRFDSNSSNLLSAVRQAGVVDEEELARMEWVWFSVLEHTQHGVETLFRLLAKDPAFFTTAVKLIYRSDTPDDSANAPPPDDVTRRRAQLAWRLLNEWKGAPGRTETGAVDQSALRDWVSRARLDVQQSGHARIGDEQIAKPWPEYLPARMVSGHTSACEVSLKS